MMVKEAELLMGSKIAKQVQADLKSELARIQTKYHEVPKLVALQIGADTASEMYVKKQGDTARELGIQHEFVRLEGTSSQEEVLKAIDRLNKDNKVHALIIQMPLPKHLNLNVILAAINPKKDAEGVHTDNLGRLVLKKEKVAPCTAIAAIELIQSTGVDLYGKEAVVVGSSKVVGRPISLLLLEHKCTVTVCSSATSKIGALEEHVKRAEILVVAVGKPHIIPGSWVRKDAVVIDIGINRVDGKTVGDVEFEEAKHRAAFITPVPGGVGPLTVTMLMKNVVQAYLWQKGELGDDE